MNESNCVKIYDKINFLKKYIITCTNCPEAESHKIHKKLSYFVADFKKYWSGSNRNKERFLTKHNDWLQTSVCFTTYVKKKNVGRPNLSFAELSERRKRETTEKLRASHSAEELSYAAQMSLRTSGHVEASKMVKEVAFSSPDQAVRYKTALKSWENAVYGQLKPTEALSMFVDAKLTRHQYNIVRSKDKQKFPSYKIVQHAKKECYPEKQHILVTDTSAEVRLQALLDITASRLIQAQRTVLNKKIEFFQNVTLISKWGFDGSSGHSEYKQKFLSGDHSDASVFLSSLVPLRLLSGDPEKQHVILWQNDRSSSTRFCRPIRFQFVKETTEIAKAERDYIENQIRCLNPSLIEINNQNIEVRHKLLFTMVDGKICNALTETTSTQKCYLCGLTSKDFNNLETVKSAEIVQSRMDFGLSVLHAWIRFFECILHLAYKLPINQWQARGEENKKCVAETKKIIQQKFKSELGLVVDKPKPGFGSSNDGNTARRFFDNAAVSAIITGVDKVVIERFNIILKTLASGYIIDTEKFKAYTLETASLFVQKYPWYPMPPTVHKILIHGPSIIEHSLLPIGQLSEEAQEASNKEFKRYRECFSRKISREKTNTDILNYLLISSDPLISSMQIVQKKSKKLDRNVLMLLRSPDIEISTKGDQSENSDTTSDSDDS